MNGKGYFGDREEFRLYVKREVKEERNPKRRRGEEAYEKSQEIVESQGKGGFLIFYWGLYLCMLWVV